MGAKCSIDTKQKLSELSCQEKKVVKKKYTKLFDAYDTDKDKKIDKEESEKFIHDFLSHNEMTLDEVSIRAGVEAVFEIADGNKDGHLTRKEFVNALLRLDEIQALVEEKLYFLTPAGAVQEWLREINDFVTTNIQTPLSKQPVVVPDYDMLYMAAGNMNSTLYPTDTLLCIHSILGRANSYDMNYPTTITLPHDHHMQPTMGVEWYWVGCNVTVVNSDGISGKVGILANMEKNRSVGLSAQQYANWSDLQTMVLTTVATVTVDVGNIKQIFRRAPNKKWGYFDASEMYYSQPGQPFAVTAGDDTWSCTTENVMPLNIIINDGSMYVNISLTPPSSIDVNHSYFYQGVPAPDGSGRGTGITPIPTPGYYYSWPQLTVTGHIIVGGDTYTITDGLGWVDHQMMMTSLSNPANAQEPVPFIQDPAPVNGWTWQFYNLNNGAAFTGASFILGAQNVGETIPYGYYITQNGNTWLEEYFIGYNIYGSTNVAPFQARAPVTNAPISMQSIVSIPITRGYGGVGFGPNETLIGTSTAWIPDGTFNNPDWTMAVENPAEYVASSGSVTGQGFLESVGWEPVENVRERQLYYLQTGTFPYNQ